MDFFIDVREEYKYIVHYKVEKEYMKGFFIGGFTDLEKANNFAKSYTSIGLQVKIDSREHINIENLIFDYFTYFRGKV